MTETQYTPIGLTQHDHDVWNSIPDILYDYNKNINELRDEVQELKQRLEDHKHLTPSGPTSPPTSPSTK